MDHGFTEVLRTLKMSRAMDFLVNTPMKASETASAVGCDSADHFSRTFRRVYGAPPQRCKQKHSSEAKAETRDGRQRRATACVASLLHYAALP